MDHTAEDHSAAPVAEGHSAAPVAEAHIAAVLAEDSLAALTVAVLTEVAHIAEDLTEVALMVMAAIAKSEFQHPDLSIHHTLDFVHWFSIIYCLDGLVHDTMAYSQHLLSWECLLDIGDEFACPGKKVF